MAHRRLSLLFKHKEIWFYEAFHHWRLWVRFGLQIKKVPFRVVCPSVLVHERIRSPAQRLQISPCAPAWLQPKLVVSSQPLPATLNQQITGVFSFAICPIARNLCWIERFFWWEDFYHLHLSSSADTRAGYQNFIYINQNVSSQVLKPIKYWKSALNAWSDC